MVFGGIPDGLHTSRGRNCLFDGRDSTCKAENLIGLGLLVFTATSTTRRQAQADVWPEPHTIRTKP